jgi:hypothetical protein
VCQVLGLKTDGSGEEKSYRRNAEVRMYMEMNDEVKSLFPVDDHHAQFFLPIVSKHGLSSYTSLKKSNTPAGMPRGGRK